VLVGERGRRAGADRRRDRFLDELHTPSARCQRRLLDRPLLDRGNARWGEGSETMIPSPATNTNVFAVPRSIAMSWTPKR
jgi:hypothetical protein